jgi:hypothetical protein
MSRLDWTKANRHSPDPARIVSAEDGGIPDGYEPLLKRMPVDEYLSQFSPKTSRIVDRIYVVKRTGRSDANAFIHETALLILRHAEKYQDASAARQLVEALPATFRRNLLIAWFGEFSPISIKSETMRLRMRKPEERRYRPFDLGQAARIPFFRLEIRGKGKLIIPEI